MSIKNYKNWTSLAVHWLRPHASTAEGTDLMPGRGTKIPHAVAQPKKKKKLQEFKFL